MNKTEIMNDIAQLTEDLSRLTAGSLIKIRGYQSSTKGSIEDLSLELLGAGAYSEMQARSLEILTEARQVGNYEGDTLTAMNQMIDSLNKAANAVAATVSKPSYEHVGGSVWTLPDKPSAIYILRLRNMGELPPPSAKGNVAQQKQILARDLDLPTARYVHAVKLEPGSFESVEY